MRSSPPSSADMSPPETSPQHSSSPTSDRKKQRLPASCSVCRKRKTKCDRLKPVCGLCKRRSISHLCFYESENHDPHVNPNVIELPPLEAPPPTMAPGTSALIYSDQQQQHHQQHHPIHLQQNHQHPLQMHQHQHHMLPPHPQIPPQPPHMVPPQVSPHSTGSMQQMPSVPPQLIPGQFPPPQNHDMGPGPGAMSGGMLGFRRPTLVSSQSYRGLFQLHSSASSSSSDALAVHPPPLVSAPVQQQQQQQPIPPIQPQPQLHLQQPQALQQLPQTQPQPQPQQQPQQQLQQQQQESVDESSNKSIQECMVPAQISPPISNPHSASEHESPEIKFMLKQEQKDPYRLDEGLVAIEIGPNSILHVLENDRMDVFSNASFAFNTEGRNWQNQGILTYVGLTKSDFFMKTLRYFALALFQSGLIRKLVKKRPQPHSAVEQPPLKSQKISNKGENAVETDSDANDEIQTPEKMGKEDEMEEDGMVVTKIDVLNEEDKAEDEEPQMVIPKEEQEGLHQELQMFIQTKVGSEPSYEAIASIALKVLPSKRKTLYLILRYYTYVHPFIPILDKKKTMDYLGTLVGERQVEPLDEPFSKLVIRSDIDLHILGVLLLVTRLGYMSMLHNSMAEVHLSELDRAVMVDVGRVSVEDFSLVVHYCIGDFMQSKSSMVYILFLTLAYFFRKVNPEDGEGLAGADSNILFSTICGASIGSGINRDPTTYNQHPTIYKNASLIQQWRSLWSYIIMEDTALAMYRGTPMNIPSLDISDVKSPTYSGEGRDECFANLWEISEGYRRICYRIANVLDKPKVAEILNYAKDLETIFLDYFGTEFFKEYICKPAPSVDDANNFGIKMRSTSMLNVSTNEDEGLGSTNSVISSRSETTVITPGTDRASQHSYKLHFNGFKPVLLPEEVLNQRAIKVMKFCKFIELRTSLSCIYFMVATHYENAYNSQKTPSMKAGIELFKIHIKSVVQLVYIMSYILDNTVELFGENYDYLITASLEKCMIKTHSFFSSFFARLLHHKKELSRQNKYDPAISARLGVLNSLFTMVILDTELFIGNFRKLGKRYKNSHRLYVMAKFFFQQCMVNPDAIFESKDPRFYHDGTNMLEFFTTSELQYLCNLCEELKAIKNEQLKTSNRRTQLGSLSRDSISPSSNISEPQNALNALMSFMGEGQSDTSPFLNFDVGDLPFDPNSFPGADLGELLDLQTFQLTPEQLDSIFPGGKGIGATNAEFVKLFEIFGGAGN